MNSEGENRRLERETWYEICMYACMSMDKLYVHIIIHTPPLKYIYIYLWLPIPTFFEVTHN